MKLSDYPFTEQQMQAASDEWGANCGPAALAFALRIGIDVVRGKIPGFEEKRYTSPTMMKAGLENLGFKYIAVTCPGNDNPRIAAMFANEIYLVRVQWTGPWTAPGASPKWAYRQTHWIATWMGVGLAHKIPMVFDCNGGIMTHEAWRNNIVPLLTSQCPRADGGWFPTHVWRPEFVGSDPQEVRP